jgi:hypothetical protein
MNDAFLYKAYIFHSPIIIIIIIICVFMVAPCIDDIKLFICPTNANKLY